jgi:hypothetical protein
MPSCLATAWRPAAGQSPAGPRTVAPAARSHGDSPGGSGAQPAAGGTDVWPLPTRIALSYLMLWAQRSSSQAWLPGDARSQGGGGLRPAGRCCGLCIGLAVVTCLEICCSPSRSPVSGLAPFGCSEPRAWLRNVSAAGSAQRPQARLPSLSGSPHRCRGSWKASRSTCSGVLSPAGEEEKVIRVRPDEDRSACAPRRQPAIRPGGPAGCGTSSGGVASVHEGRPRPPGWLLASGGGL